MHISLLLMSLLALGNVNAVPAPEARPGMVTIPLKKLHKPRSDIHPTVLLQQHVNRGHRRLARMTGAAAPSTEEMKRNLERRMFLTETGPGSRRPSKRLFRDGTVSSALEKLRTANQQIKTNQAKNKGQGQAGAGNAAGGNATAGASQGVDPKEAEAAVNGGLTQADPPTGQNSIGLDIEANDVGYIGALQIGTPPQQFLALMDSGSADFWVGGEQCQTIQEAQPAAAQQSVQSSGKSGKSRNTARGQGQGQGQGQGAQGQGQGGQGKGQQGGQAGGAAANGCGNHQFLGAQSSSSFVDTQKPFQVSYGQGAVEGTIVTDNVNIAGLALNKHTFGVAQGETVDFSSDQTTFDGLIGLAQSGLSEQGVQTPVEALAAQNLIDAPITSFKLARLSDGNDGEITFGGLDPAKFDQNNIVTVDNVNPQGFWEAALDGVTADGKDLGLNGRTAILDTGTTLMIVPDQDANAIHAAIPGAKSDGQGGFTIPCTTTTSLALSFGGMEFPIDARDLAFAPVDPNDLTGDCVSGIASGNIGGANEWLVGDTFLKNAYFSTNVATNQLSLAKLL